MGRKDLTMTEQQELKISKLIDLYSRCSPHKFKFKIYAEAELMSTTHVNLIFNERNIKSSNDYEGFTPPPLANRIHEHNSQDFWDTPNICNTLICHANW